MASSYLPQLAELRARRIISQGLAPSDARPDWCDTKTKPAKGSELSAAWAVAHGMIALQGQKYSSGIAGISVRGGGNPAEVQAAIDSFEIVRCWSQRGTLHFVTAQDARGLMQLTNPRVEKAAARRRTGLGLTPDDVHTARAAFHSELRTRGIANLLTRKESYELFADHGVDPNDQRGPHLLRAFGGEGDVVQGPRKGAEETFVLVEALPIYPADSSDKSVGNECGDAAATMRILEDIAWRYVNSRGPVCVDDLAWWLGITKSETKKALSLLGDRIIPFDITHHLAAAAEELVGTAAEDSVTKDSSVIDEFTRREYIMPAWQADVTTKELEAALSHTLLLPAFDEYLMGYGSRNEILDDSLRNQVLTKNGLSWPFIVENGVITGRQ